MSKHHVDAVFKQFPWLHSYFGTLKPKLEYASVSRADIKRLNATTGLHHPIPFGGNDYRQKMFLFDRNGAFISTVHGTKWHHRIIEFLNLDKFGAFRHKKSLGETLIELGDKASECTYIVETVNTSCIEVIRAPKGRTFVDLLREKRNREARDSEQAREEIKKEMTS